jgi:hypothetical protein
MNNRPMQRILFVAGVGAALVGLYLASQSNHELEWDGIVTIAVMAAGIFLASITAVSLLAAEEGTDREVVGPRSVMPSPAIPLVYGGFVGGIAVVAGLVVGHYNGRNEGLMTFILAFVLANAVFGLGLWLGRQPSYR